MDKNLQYESKDKMVSHPDHYQSESGIEVIDVIKAFTANLKGIEATDTGNVIKYACRWDKKGKPIQDIEKVIWYATHLLNELKNKEAAKKLSTYERCIKEGLGNGIDTLASISTSTNDCGDKIAIKTCECCIGENNG